MADQIQVGKFYQWGNGTVVFCIDENLETFTGVVIIVGLPMELPANKVGKISKNFNADGDWVELEAQFKRD